MRLYCIFIIVLLAIPMAAASYEIEVDCHGDCREGKRADVMITLDYNIIAMNDQQVAFYNNSEPLRQTYVSGITVKRIMLRDKVFNTTFLDMPVTVIFADPRMPRNKGLDALPKRINAQITLPLPTQKSTLSFIPCFELAYVREIREYNFFTGDYDSNFISDAVEQCGNEIVDITVIPRFVPACVPMDCEWYQQCDERGCRFFWGYIFFGIFALGIIILAIWLWKRHN